MVVRMKKLYDLVSKPTATRKLSCSDCMTETKAFRKSRGVILFIARLGPNVASIAHCAAGFDRHEVQGLGLLASRSPPHPAAATLSCVLVSKSLASCRS